MRAKLLCSESEKICDAKHSALLYSLHWKARRAILIYRIVCRTSKHNTRREEEEIKPMDAGLPSSVLCCISRNCAEEHNMTD